MDISYDKDADAVYIEFRKGEFSKDKKIQKHTRFKPSIQNEKLIP